MTDQRDEFREHLRRYPPSWGQVEAAKLIIERVDAGKQPPEDVTDWVVALSEAIPRPMVS